MALLVLDEQLANPRLATALAQRGIPARSVGDFGVTGRPDPDVVRRIQEGTPKDERWILVTMDLTIIDDNRGFDWDRYAIAWIAVRDDLRGGQVEQAKADIVHRHAHTIREQEGGDHHTYTATHHFRHPPSLASLTRLRNR